MKVYMVEYIHYESSEVIGCYTTEELAEKYIEKDIQSKWGSKAKTSRYSPSYWIKEIKVIGE